VARSVFHFSPAQPGGRLTRSRTDRVVAGVAGGLAARLGLDPVIVRIGFVVLTVAGGSGALLYLAAWLVLPKPDDQESIAQAALRDTRQRSQTIGIALIAVGVLLIQRQVGLSIDTKLLWPAALGGAGLAVIWRQADDDDRATLRQVTSHLGLPAKGTELRARRLVLLRIGVGVTLVIGGVGSFLAATHAFAALQAGVAATAGILGGIALIFGPWWWRLVQDLTEERRERIRSQERAEMARHVHDSVLQTLALIQRQADDPRSVVSLARHQERELRGWLYGGPVLAPDLSLRSAVERAAAEVEQRHGVAVDAVVVGDCPLDDRLTALVAAAREAMVNAAQWSGARSVSLYAEVEETRVSLFVRDRGKGFDPSLVPSDHRGIADSIKGRMASHGGTAEIRTAHGEGTEVELSVPQVAPAS
jgi:signal transduction histidine kinase